MLDSWRLEERCSTCGDEAAACGRRVGVRHAFFRVLMFDSTDPLKPVVEVERLDAAGDVQPPQGRMNRAVDVAGAVSVDGIPVEPDVGVTPKAAWEDPILVMHIGTAGRLEGCGGSLPVILV